jgi:hypothetical protein
MKSLKAIAPRESLLEVKKMSDKQVKFYKSIGVDLQNLIGISWLSIKKLRSDKMIVNSHVIGSLVALRRVEVDGFVNGNWENDIPKIELTILSESLDIEGQKNISVDKIFLDAKHYNDYKDKLNSHLAIPYKMETTKKGQKFEYDDSMPILELKDSLLNLTKPESAKK